MEQSNFYSKKAKGIEYFYCNRSGRFDEKPIEDRKRQLNIKGTSKINNFCTSYIKLKVIDQKLNVSYVKTHYGHDKEVSFLKIPDEIKVNIASKLSEGISPDSILKEIRENNNSSIQEHLINKKDLRSIKNHFRIEDNIVRRDPNEVISLRLAVEHHKESVLFFKCQGEKSSEFPELDENDFVLAYAQKDQTEVALELLKQQNSAVKSDGTHGLNTCDFLLHTLMTVDRSKKVFPFSFLISNKETYTVLKIWFTKLKQKFGQFDCEIFMSDDADQYYSAWCSVFGSSTIISSSIDLPELCVDLPEPSIDLPEPSIDLPEPSIDLPELCVDLPEPCVDLPEPPVDLSEPCVDLPEPCVDLPEPPVDLSDSNVRKQIKKNPKKLVCSWHIDRSHSKKITQLIKNPTDRNSIYYGIYSMRHALSKDKFEEKLDKFRSKWANYRDLMQYFETYYFNRPDVWAYYNRIDTGHNTNTHPENINFQIKYIYFDGKKIRRIDTMFEGLTEFYKMKYTDYLKKQIRPVTSKWLTKCFQNHQDAIINYNQTEISIVDKYKFKVKSVFNKPVVDGDKLIIISREWIKVINKDSKYVLAGCSTDYKNKFEIQAGLWSLKDGVIEIKITKDDRTLINKDQNILPNGWSISKDKLVIKSWAYSYEVYECPLYSREICKDCELRCRNCKSTCVHQFVCGCEDYKIRLEFCSHIHHVIEYMNRESSHLNNRDESTNNGRTSPMNYELDDSINSTIQMNLEEAQPSSSVILDKIRAVQTPDNQTEMSKKLLIQLDHIDRNTNIIRQQLRLGMSENELKLNYEKARVASNALKKSKLQIRHHQNQKRKQIHQKRFFSTKKKAKKPNLMRQVKR